MKNRDWKNVFGHAPKSFLDQVDEAIERIEEGKDMKRRYKLSTVLIAAALVVMMTGAALAAGIGLIEGINRREMIVVPDSAQELVQSELGTLSTDLFDMNVEAAMTDGRSVFVQVRLIPKEPEEYVLMRDEYRDPDEESGAYIFAENERDIDGTLGRLIGRADGRKIIKYNVRMKLPWKQLYGWDIRNNEDGSVTLWFRGSSDEEIKQHHLDRLTIECWWGVHGEYSEEDVPEGWDWFLKNWLPETETMTASLTNMAEKTGVRLEASGESENGILQFIGGGIRFSPLMGYYDLQYDHDLDEDELLLWMQFVDAQGNPIPDLDGRGSSEFSWETNSLSYTQTGLMQTFEEIPEKLYLELINWAEERKVIDRLEVKLIPAE